MKIVVFLLAFILITFGLAVLLRRSSIYKGDNPLLLSMAITIIAVAVIANALGAMDVFSFRNVIICMGTVGVVLNVVNAPYVFRQRGIVSGESVWQWVKKGIPAVAVVAVAFFMFSIFRIDPIMSADAQIYYYKTLNISATGTIAWPHDAYMSENYDELRDVVYLTEEAYSEYEYGNSDDPGDYVVTELHLYSSLLAVGYKILGDAGISLMCAAAAAFAVFAVYQNFWGFLKNKKLALAAIALMIICPAELYCARTCLSEVLTQLIIWTGILVFNENLERSNVWGIVFGGFLIGLSTFNRIDAYIYIVSIYIVFIYWIVVKNSVEQMKYFAWGVFTLTVTSVLGFLYAYTFSYPYTYEHLRSGHLTAIILLAIVLLLVSGVLCILKKSGKISENIEVLLYGWLQQKHGAEILAIAVGVVIFFLYFLRPELSTGETDAELWISMTMKQFCYYTSVVSMPLLVYSIYHLLKHINENHIEHKMIYLILGGINFFIYTIFPSVAARNYWASRRWMPVVIPFVFMMALYALAQLFYQEKLKKGIVRTVYIFIFCYLLFEAKALNMGKVNTYAYGHVWNLANTLSDDVVWFCDNKRLTCALRGYFGKKNVYMLNIENTEQIEQYIAEHGEMYFLGSDPFLFLDEDVEAELITQCPILVQSVEDSYDIPREVKEMIVAGNLYLLQR